MAGLINLQKFMTWRNKQEKKMSDYNAKKFDKDKPRAELLTGMSLALAEVAKLLTFGATKYAAHSWKEVPNGEERYNGAMLRHIFTDEDVDPETGLSHDVAVACNALFKLQLRLMREAKDKDVKFTPEEIFQSRSRHKPSFICCDECGYGLDNKGRCLTPSCKNYAMAYVPACSKCNSPLDEFGDCSNTGCELYNFGDLGSVCPVCKHPMGIKGCTNAACEER